MCYKFKLIGYSKKLYDTKNLTNGAGLKKSSFFLFSFCLSKMLKLRRIFIFGEKEKIRT